MAKTEDIPSRKYACKASRSNKRSKNFDKKPKRRQITNPAAAADGAREHAVMVRGRWRKMIRMVDKQEGYEWMNVSSGTGSSR